MNVLSWKEEARLRFPGRYNGFLGGTVVFSLTRTEVLNKTLGITKNPDHAQMVYELNTVLPGFVSQLGFFVDMEEGKKRAELILGLWFIQTRTRPVGGAE